MMTDDKDLQETLLGGQVDGTEKPETMDLLVPVPADLTGFSLEGVDGANGELRQGAFVGRYEVIRRLGFGGFGVVFLAKDSDLGRLVAIKLPHEHRMENESFRQMYLVEARTLASLDHPSIVPIYDCGVIADGRCFVVSKYIEGRDLSRVVAEGPMNPVTIARLLADIADALDHVHQMRIVHRDIKPANLLLGDDGRIYLADFGLALQDGPIQVAGPNAGTPNYMSPEQIRGEGHRVDGRSDQFSLGVVMYELLTGDRPFAGGSPQEVLHRVETLDPLPPLHRSANVPVELDRICMKLLSKLSTQRYSVTSELASDLREWLKSTESAASTDLLQSDALPSTLPYNHVDANQRRDGATTIVPRGLRAFTRVDAYFFQNLLPGTRDRDGLPVTISHWRRWATIRDEFPDLQRVGVISGPTGCGKSSLVRAGLLPSLPGSVVSVLVEATPDLTESQLLSSIERRCGELAGNSLPDTLAMIRRGEGLREGKSLLLVIDQFEQWLHAHPNPKDSTLVRAIRQCDGIRVQCVVMIRDDFWLALSRFMEAVESTVQLGRNAMMIDLFDLRHARKVLIEFGRGYERLPRASEPLTREQEKFIDGAIEILSEDGKIVPVHLALFAEMVKSRDWLPSTLRQLGGSVGIGAQFLHDSFSAGYAPANQRGHEKAARALLQALLPDLGTEIKAGRRTRDELFLLSGYDDDRHRFDLLMMIMESDLKLISASDTLDKTRSDSIQQSIEQTTYQLSHDFLVPSIRDWLTARQRESYRGRLHQRLSEQASLWSRNHDARFLPNFVEWAAMRVCLAGRKKTPIERQMLSKRDLLSLNRLAVAGVLIAAIVFAYLDLRAGNAVNALVAQLATAHAEQATGIIDSLVKYGADAEDAVDAAIVQSSEDPRRRFLLKIGQLRWKPDAVEEVFQIALHSESPEDVLAAREALLPYAGKLRDRCWKVVEKAAAAESANRIQSGSEAFRASQLLALLAPPDNDVSRSLWHNYAQLISDLLVNSCIQHPDQYLLLAGSMEPAVSELIDPLSRYLGSEADDNAARFGIALLDRYTQSNPALKTRLCLDASEWQTDSMIPKPEDLDVAVLNEVVGQEAVADATEARQNVVARRQAMAAALLLAQGAAHNPAALWQLLKESSNNTLRSNFIHQFALRDVPIDLLVNRLALENDADIVANILLAMGEYGKTEVESKAGLHSQIVELYSNHPSASVHSAAEWLLKRWGETSATIRRIPVEVTPSDKQAESSRQWMRLPDQGPEAPGHTLVRIDGTGDADVGRKLLVATHEVTIAQMHGFDPYQYVAPHITYSEDSPAHVITWPRAVAYCNWLSKREGLEPFYPSEIDAIQAWRSTPDDLMRPGYRLPTVAEWKFFCRAGTSTPGFYGTDQRLMKKYQWYEDNNEDYCRQHGLPLVHPDTGDPLYPLKPVGLLKPNGFGLFDVFGNVDEWCDDPGRISQSERAIRGGHAAGNASYFHWDREASVPWLLEYNSIGFRIVRTIP